MGEMSNTCTKAHPMGGGCPYCRIAALEEEVSKLTELNKAMEYRDRANMWFYSRLSDLTEEIGRIGGMSFQECVEASERENRDER